MGIALLALSDLFMPLQSLAHRWMTLPSGGRRRRAAPVELEADLRYVQVRPSSAAGARPPSRPAARPLRPLRVVRGAETGKSRTGGRVLLSGRMEDVCAELDRLAALEAAQGPAVPARHLH